MSPQRGDSSASEIAPGGDLFFAFVRALGTDVKSIEKTLSAQLKSAGFGDEPVKLSLLLGQLDVQGMLEDTPLHRRYVTHMDMGDDFRASSEAADSVALLGVHEISRLRAARLRALKSQKRSARYEKRGWSYQISSLMRPEEVKTLRQIYGQQFFVISVGSPLQTRLEKMTTDISRSLGRPSEECIPLAMDLLNRDAGHPPGSGGIEPHSDVQPVVADLVDRKWRVDVEKTFHLADVFVSPDKKPESLKVLQRFVDLLFSHPFHTPTKDELGMYVAHGFALRSSALGRRVGAAIATRDGEFLAAGANEVAKAGGGFYWEGEDPDHRDFQLGIDSNDIQTREVLSDLLVRLKQAGWFVSKRSAMTPEDMINAVMADSELRHSRVLDVIEFGRPVHAEMAALTQAARAGIPIEGSTLYCTTFPCHECARHIVAGGIRRVVYIEAYPKSRVADLFQDSIGLAALASETGNKVVFEPFVGIGPRRFEELFSWVARKKADEGDVRSAEVVDWDLATAPVRDSVVPPKDEYRRPKDRARNESEGIGRRVAGVRIDGFRKLRTTNPNLRKK